MNIALIDPSIRARNLPSINLGDVIITKSVVSELKSAIPNAKIRRISSHTPISVWRLYDILRSKHIIVGGTNILSSDVETYNQWKIGKYGKLVVHQAVLMGAGWWQYQPPALRSSKEFYRSVLASSKTHSLRDNYSLGRFREMGDWSAVNTSCPTMWSIGDRCINHRAKSNVVLATVTDYLPSPSEDKAFLRCLASRYQQVFVWPQGSYDAAYLQSLGEPVNLLEHSMASLDCFLMENPGCDYVGTRLHCGIYCLGRGHRSLIVTVDNRALEIAKDTMLPVIPRGDLQALSHWLNAPRPVSMSIDQRSIELWKRQFSEADG
jgi:polysaccharide pyruvyl transferase WcaK-like protein